MAKKHLLLCGGLTAANAPQSWRKAHRVSLEIGGEADVHLALNQLTDPMCSAASDVDLDLLEIASFVYAADQAISRGGTTKIDYGDDWRRPLRFEIPVRCPGVWNAVEIQRALRTALGFLTDDVFEFRFHQAINPRRPSSYLFQGSPGEEFDSVVLFSGGLDSLCGAVEEVVTHRRRILLVSHCSSTRVAARQEQLFEALRNCVPKARQPVRIPVTINKDGDLNQDFSQRSRSFVFAAVAAVVARLAGRDRIRFYENGVTSLNLPLSAEEVGARASRTTHPQSLARFGELFSLLFETAFTVENRYQWKTKAEMLCELREHAHLAALTCSCGHVWGKEESSPHCGKCLQCVDRRLSALAAGLSEAEDPPSDYASDPLASEREGPDLTLAERYVGIAREVAKLDSPRSFAVRFPEVNAALAYLGCSPEEAAKACYNLYQSHATGVQIALGRAFAAVGVLNWQAFPPHSLLGVVQGRTLPQGDCTKTLMI